MERSGHTKFGARGFARIGALSVLALGAVLLGGCGVHTDYFETRAFEVTVDLTAEGQRMQITQAIECEPWRRREAGLIPYTQWRPKTKSFGRRLPSDAAVMMVTPSFCRSAYRKEGSTSDVLPVSEGHVPYIGWADDAGNPTVVEAYISPEYFKRSDARVVYHGMTARIVSSVPSEGGKNNEFEWFENRHDINKQNVAFGLYAQAVGKDAWQQIPEVVDYLRGIHSPRILPLELTFRLGKKQATAFWGRDRATAGLGLMPSPSPDRSYDRSRANNEAMDIYPLVKSGDVFGVSINQRGLIRFYRIGGVTDKLTATRSIVLKVGQTILDLPVTWAGVRTVYDPNSETVYQILSGLPTRFPNHAP